MFEVNSTSCLIQTQPCDYRRIDSKYDRYLHRYAVLVSLLGGFVALLLCHLALTVVVRLLNDVRYSHHLSEVVLSLGAQSAPLQFH